MLLGNKQGEIKSKPHVIQSIKLYGHEKWGFQMEMTTDAQLKATMWVQL